MAEAIGSVDSAIANSKIESLCRTFFCNKFSDSFIPRANFDAGFQEILQHMKDYLKYSLEGSISKSVSYMRFAHQVLDMMRGSKLIKTPNGLF